MHKAEKRRKRIVLTLEEKLGVIQERGSGIAVDRIAEKYNIGASTVSEIWKRRSEIEFAVEKNKMSGVGQNRKTLKESSKPLVESELYNWYLEQKEQDIKLHQQDFIDKAKEINAQIIQEEADTEAEAEEWNPTKGWLVRFKDRFGIKPEPKSQEVRPTWQSALEAAEYLLEYINTRDFLLKDVITVRMIRDKIASEPETTNQSFDY